MKASKFTLYLITFSVSFFFSVEIHGQLSGTFYISDTSFYNTPARAIDSLESQGIDSNVVFKILPGTYEGRFEIGTIPGAGPVDSIVFESSTGDSSDVILTDEALEADSNYVVSFVNSAGYVTFRNLTLQATGVDYSRVLWFEGTPRRITFSHCEISGTDPSEGVDYNKVLIECDENALPDSLSFFNNLVREGSIGFYMRSQSTTPDNPLDELIIQNNRLERMGYNGVMVQRASNMTISGNQITAAHDGIHVSETFIFGEILGNTIFAGYNGIHYGTTNLEMNEPGLIANNFIHLGDSADFGIYLSGDNAFQIFFNTVYVTKDTPDNYGLGTSSDLTQGLEVINNLFAHQNDGSPLNLHDISVIETMDFNGYYTPGNFIMISPDRIFNLEALRSYTGEDANSFTVYPVFQADSNLHALTPWYDGKGTPLAGITTDIDGESRDLTNPDIGADEYTPNSAYIPPYSGIYTVGTSGEFDDLSQAIDSLKVKGMSGDVTLELLSGTYQVQERIPTFSGSGFSSRLTITSQTQDSSDVVFQSSIQGAEDNYLLYMEGTDFTTLSHLTLDASSNSQHSHALQFNGGMEHVIVSNNVLTGAFNAADETANALLFAEENYFEEILLSRNLLDNSSYGIYFQRSDVGQPYPLGLKIERNTIQNAGYGGVFIERSHAPVLEQNQIISGSRGVEFHSCEDSLKVLGNQVNLENGYGVYLNSTIATTNSRGLLANNFITVDGSSIAHGIYLEGSDYHDVFYNSVNITSTTSSNSRALYISFSDHISLVNNIFHHAGTRYAYYLDNALVDESNYNNLYSSGTLLAYVDGVSYFSLEDLQNATGNDQQSLSVIPDFVSDTDLHISTDSLDGRATPLSLIQRDIDGHARDPVNPDIGADEFDPPENQPPFVLNPIPDVEIPEDNGLYEVALLDTVFSDPDAGDQLTFAAASNNADVEVSIESDILSVESALHYNGNAQIIIEASDPSDSVALDTFLVTILPVNDPPYLVRSIRDVEADEDPGVLEIAELDTIFDDVDAGEVLSYSAVSDTNAIEPVINSGVLNLDFAQNYNGTGRVFVTARDAEDATVSDTFEVTLLPVNDTPLVVKPITDQEYDEDSPSIDLADLDSVFYDPDPGTLNYSFSSPATELNLELSGSVLSMSPEENYNGIHEIQVAATDGQGAMEQDVFQLIINAVNDPPLAQPDFITTSESVLIYVTANDSDIDEDALFVTEVSESNAGSVEIAPGDTTIRYTPFDFSESYDTLEYVVTDFQGGYDTSWVYITLELPEEYFTLTNKGVDNLSHGSLMLGDYDGDQDLDLFINGWTGSGSEYVTKIYENEAQILVPTSFDLENLSPGKENAAVWFDYRNEANLGLLITGTGSNDPYNYHTILYRMEEGNYVEEEINLPDFTNGSVDYGDYDQDGDVDLLFTGTLEGEGNRTKIFRNERLDSLSHIRFSELSAVLGVMENGTGKWIDFDGDQDLDIFITGSTYSQLYENRNGIFAEMDHSIVGMSRVSAALGDYDQDGDPDLLIAGRHNGKPTSKIYRNDGSLKKDLWNFTDIGAGLTGVESGSVSWGDLDGDGDLDVVLSGVSEEGKGLTRVFLNYDNSFMPIFSRLPDLTHSAVALGDYDGDMDLDIFLMGMHGSQPLTIFARNNMSAANTTPTEPFNLRAEEVDATTAVLAWESATDNETPVEAVSYNLRVGTSTGGAEVMSPMSFEDGISRIPGSSNAGTTENWRITGLLPETTYYWSVQALDQSWLPSPFAEEQEFTTPEAGTLIAETEAEMDLIIYPNPFRESCIVQYYVGGPGEVRVEVFNELGSKVIILEDHYNKEGKYTLTFSPEHPGMYYVRFIYESNVILKKVIRIK